MNPDKYIPNPEELKEAEGHMTPEQKIQSEAREEGYKLGEEKGKKVVYVGTVHSIEKEKSSEIIKFEFKLTVGHKIWKHFVNFIQNEAKNNGVNVKYSVIPNNDVSVFKFYLEGPQASIKRVVENVDSMLKVHKENSKSIFDGFKGF